MKRHSMVAREIDKLKEKLLLLGGLVEDNLKNAVWAVENTDAKAAEAVISKDDEIDHAEVELEEECLKVLALHQPVAVDLRFIVTVLKVNNDLERIGDLAASLAENAIFLADRPHLNYPFDFGKMAYLTQIMLKDSLDALVEHSTVKAMNVRKTDDLVDDLNRHMYEGVKEQIHQNPQSVDTLINYMRISRCFERIADLSTNIAEDVIYLVSGEIVRH